MVQCGYQPHGVRDVEQTKYAQVAQRLQQGIANGEFPNGQKLPSENELVAQTGYSRQTIRQAMALLESQGLTKRVRGSGTFVCATTVHRPKTHNIAVVTTYIGEYIFPAILQGISETLTENGYTPFLSATQNRVDTERSVLKSLMQKPIDGLIVEGTKTALPNPNIDLYEEIRHQGIPVVFVNGYYAQLRDPVYVVMDDYEGGRMACEALLCRGHRRIAGIFKSDDMQGHRRYAGFADALVQAGLQVEDDHVLWYTTEYRDLVVKSSARTALSGCTAVVCYNDEMTLKVMDACKEPNLAWVSFDQSAYARVSGAPFGSLGNQKEALGRLAAQKLISLLNGAVEQPSVLPWIAMVEDAKM